MVIVGQDPYFGPKQAHGTFRLILHRPSLPFPSPFVPREGGSLGVCSLVEILPATADKSSGQASVFLFLKGSPSLHHWSTYALPPSFNRVCN